MSRKHRAPVLGFVFMAVVCTVVLAYSIRGNATGQPEYALPGLGVATLPAAGRMFDPVPEPSDPPTAPQPTSSGIRTAERLEPGERRGERSADRDARRPAVRTAATTVELAPSRASVRRHGAAQRHRTRPPVRADRSRRHSCAGHPGKGHGVRQRAGGRHYAGARAQQRGQRHGARGPGRAKGRAFAHGRR